MLGWGCPRDYGNQEKVVALELGFEGRVESLRQSRNKGILGESKQSVPSAAAPRASTRVSDTALLGLSVTKGRLFKNSVNNLYFCKIL